MRILSEQMVASHQAGFKICQPVVAFSISDCYQHNTGIMLMQAFQWFWQFSLTCAYICAILMEQTKQDSS